MSRNWTVSIDGVEMLEADSLQACAYWVNENRNPNCDCKVTIKSFKEGSQ